MFKKVPKKNLTLKLILNAAKLNKKRIKLQKYLKLKVSTKNISDTYQKLEIRNRY